MYVERIHRVQCMAAKAKKKALKKIKPGKSLAGAKVNFPKILNDISFLYISVKLFLYAYPALSQKKFCVIIFELAFSSISDVMTFVVLDWTYRQDMCCAAEGSGKDYRSSEIQLCSCFCWIRNFHSSVWHATVSFLRFHPDTTCEVGEFIRPTFTWFNCQPATAAVFCSQFSRHECPSSWTAAVHIQSE